MAEHILYYPLNISKLIFPTSDFQLVLSFQTTNENGWQLSAVVKIYFTTVLVSLGLKTTKRNRQSIICLLMCFNVLTNDVSNWGHNVSLRTGGIFVRRLYKE